MSNEAPHSDGGAGDAVQLQLVHTRISKSRIRLTAYLVGEVIYQDEVNLSNAAARSRYAKKVAERTNSNPEEIEAQLLTFAAALAEAYDQGAALGEQPPPYQNITDHDDPERRGLYHNHLQLTNTTLEITEDITTGDDTELRREYRCQGVFNGTTSEFTVAAADFASNNGFAQAIYEAVGPKVRIMCQPHVLRTAVSAVSSPQRRILTTNYGWSKDNDVFLTPSVRIDAAGIHPVGPADPVRVDLAGEECARHLDAVVPKPHELPRLKKHLVGSFMPLHNRRVTSSLLAAAALSVLMRFAPGMNRPGIWLVGLTGGGKSFLARLVMNLFGDFPPDQGRRLGSWSSSWKSLQRTGSFFKDALFLVDDYKPEMISHKDAVTLLQNYADSSGRGRLKVDATANVTRPIRGILLSTGEDIPESAASAVARNVIVRTPSSAKDTRRGRRCLKRCGRYRALMAAFIHHLIHHGRTAEFSKRVKAEVDFFYKDIAGAQNDLRIAGNVGLMAAAFREFAAFLGDAWPAWEQAADDFVTKDLVALRDEMLAAARGQQASEVFLAALSSLAVNGRVQFQNWNPPHVSPDQVATKQIVGRRISCTHPEHVQTVEVSTQLALGAVQESLRRQGRPALALTEKALIMQLANAGKLLDKFNQPIPPESGGDHTWAIKLAGATKNVFRIRISELLGEEPDGLGGDEPSN